MDDDFHRTLADWHRAEGEAVRAEREVRRLGDDADASQAAALRADAVRLRMEADDLLDAVRRLAGAARPNG